MRLAIEIIWWIGIIGALVPTLVILKEALLVIGALRGILRLAEATHVAAQGIGVHVHPAEKLEGLTEIAQRLDADVVAATAGLRKIVGRSGGGGQ